MYTLQKAKEDINAVAKHATDIAVHAIAVADDVEAKLERFKTEILSAMDEKFAELGRTIRGDDDSVESTAIADLGAKVSLLSRTVVPPAAVNETKEHPEGGTEHQGDGGHQGEVEHRGEGENHGGTDHHGDSQDQGWNHDQRSEQHHHD